MLLETGADIQREGKGQRPDRADVRRGLDRADVVKLLLARGADLDSVDVVASPISQALTMTRSSPMARRAGRAAGAPPPARHGRRRRDRGRSLTTS